MEKFSRGKIATEAIIHLCKFTLPKRSYNGNTAVNNLLRTFLPFTQAPNKGERDLKKQTYKVSITLQCASQRQWEQIEAYWFFYKFY